MASWNEIFNASISDLDPERYISQIEDEGTNILFATNAALVKSYIELTSYFPSEYDTVLSLAKADSWYTTSALMVHLSYWKGAS